MDRKKDVVISGGENLYPVQIEDFLRAFGKIKDVAVIGLPHPRLGEIAAAIIEIREGMTCTEEEINDFCLALPRYKRPRKIIFDQVPRNPTGKIENPLCGRNTARADWWRPRSPAEARQISTLFLPNVLTSLVKSAKLLPIQPEETR